MKQIGIAMMFVLGTAGAASAQPSQNPLTYEMTLEGLAGGKKNTTLTVESWSWGASAYEPSELEVDAAAAKTKHKDVNAQDLYFTIEQSPVSALLVDALVGKKVMPKVTIRSKMTGSDKTFELVLKDVRVSSYQLGGSGWGSGPSESLSFVYKTAKVTVGGGGATQSAEVAGNAK